MADSPGDTAPSVAAGMSAAGETVVTWAVQRVRNGPREVWVAVAPPGGASAAAVAPVTDRVVVHPAVALRAEGAAVVAWTGCSTAARRRSPGTGPAASAPR